MNFISSLAFCDLPSVAGRPTSFKTIVETIKSKTIKIQHFLLNFVILQQSYYSFTWFG